MLAWYTPEPVMAVLDEAADLGINAVWTPCYDQWIRLWNEYQEKGAAEALDRPARSSAHGKGDPDGG